MKIRILIYCIQRPRQRAPPLPLQISKLLGAAERGAIYPTQEVAILVPLKLSHAWYKSKQPWYFWKERDLMNTLP